MYIRLSRLLVAVGSVLCLASTMLCGCAASRALDKPAPKNYGVLKPGTNRDLVRAELGLPQQSVSQNDCDVFAFEKGSSGWKYFRAIGYSLLDVGTLGVSEVVANPAEAGVGKEKVRVRVCYGTDQNVMYSERLEVGKPVALMTGAYPPPAPKMYTVSGGISGLVGGGLVLQLNGAQNTIIKDNGAFVFTTGLADGTQYVVSVAVPPTGPSQTCGIERPSGTLNGGGVSNIVVSCTINSFSVWGQVSGLVGSGLALQNNGAADLPVAANGAVKFSTPVLSGTTYHVSVLSQPTNPAQTCAVSGSSGTVTNSDATATAVNCVTDLPLATTETSVPAEVSNGTAPAAGAGSAAVPAAAPIPTGPSAAPGASQ